MTESARSLQLKGLRVLVVEDEALVALQLEDMLADLGCAIIGPASRVCQALNLLSGQRVDAAVLDLNVAGELVYPVADALASRTLPYIFATGYWRRGVDRALPQPACAPEAVSTEPAPQGDAGQPGGCPMIRPRPRRRPARACPGG